MTELGYFVKRKRHKCSLLPYDALCSFDTLPARTLETDLMHVLSL